MVDSAFQSLLLRLSNAHKNIRIKILFAKIRAAKDGVLFSVSVQFTANPEILSLSDTKSQKSLERSISGCQKSLKHFLTIILCSWDLHDHKKHDKYPQYTTAIPRKCCKCIWSRYDKLSIFSFCRPWAQPERSAKREYAQFTIAILNAFTSFSRHRHGILLISIMFFMIMQISRV